MKGGIGWNLRISGVERYHKTSIWCSCISRNDYKTASIRKFLYMQFCIKVVVLNRSYSTNTHPIWKRYIPQEPENLRFAPIVFFLAFWIDIIDNNITYSPYSPYYVTRTSANGSAVCWSRETYRRNLSVTLIIINWNI